jgi:hypothetical protein
MYDRSIKLHSSTQPFADPPSHFRMGSSKLQTNPQSKKFMLRENLAFAITAA